ncbi:hypothetical protein ABE485_17880 [Achromobacter spanius]|uniref:hypothetical protein n=1 Tax=Achromobacter spanius TaxID=217203 RepID=UPI003207E451
MLRFPSALTGALALAALLACGAAQAARDACPQAADIVRAAYPQAPAPDADGNVRLGRDNVVIRISDAEFGEPFAVTCKAWPANPDLLLAAIPLMQDRPDQDDGHDGDLRILVLDRATLKVLHDLRLDGLMSDDAVRLGGVSFDTARYDVAPGRRAFGLRISREGSSRANPFSETSLRLFDIGPKGLDMVLDGLVVDRSNGEWDTNCAGEFTERSVSLAMGGGSANGLRDLTATESHESSRAAMQHGDCVEKILDKGKTTRTLKFDGRRYQIPEPLRSLDRETAG